VRAAATGSPVALELGLHFTPLAEETYFLACLKANIEDAVVPHLCNVLAGQGWSDILAALPDQRRDPKRSVRAPRGDVGRG
jgi:molybdate-binding protein